MLTHRCPLSCVARFSLPSLPSFPARVGRSVRFDEVDDQEVAGGRRLVVEDRRRLLDMQERIRSMLVRQTERTEASARTGAPWWRREREAHTCVLHCATAPPSPDCKFPGDDCPPMWGACNHPFHMSVAPGGPRGKAREREWRLPRFSHERTSKADGGSSLSVVVSFLVRPQALHPQVAEVADRQEPQGGVSALPRGLGDSSLDSSSQALLPPSV